MLPTFPDAKNWLVEKRVPLWEIKEGDILDYLGHPNQSRPDFLKRTIHRAVQKDRGGWIMSGDNNRYTESWARVNEDNYFGKVLVLVLPQ